MNVRRDEVEFLSGSNFCRAWLFRPVQSEDSNSACIVMAHGLGGTRDASLEPYARLFAESGYAVLVFDYRHFGDSEGTPRQLLSVSRQLEDWSSAVTFARMQADVNPAKIALWGTSFSGGHVVVVAARDGEVAAISAQGPMMDMIAAFKNYLQYAGMAHFVKAGALGALDIARSAAGGPPVYVPIVANPGELAVMSTDDALPGYLAIAPPDWRNEICARFALTSLMYRPISKAKDVQCPALIQVCMKDSVAPVEPATTAAVEMGKRVKLQQFDCGHFDIYQGEYYERASQEQLAFFNRSVLNSG